MNSVKFSRVVVIGVGLIGGSFALALKKAGVAREIIGVGRQHKNLQRAIELGVIDSAVPLEQAIQGADLILLAVPVAQTETVLHAIAAQLEPQTLITDGGSTKQDVIAAARAALGGKFNQFVAAHPIAGSEHSGVEAAKADLYQSRRVILCPAIETPAAALGAVRAVWQACGAQVSSMSAAQHDAVFAAVSHLPHMLAFAYMNHILASAESAMKLHMGGTGFRDFTRIAGGNAEMWADIALANRVALLEEIEHYQATLQELKEKIAAGERDALRDLIETSSQARRQWKM